MHSLRFLSAFAVYALIAYTKMRAGLAAHPSPETVDIDQTFANYFARTIDYAIEKLAEKRAREAAAGG